MRSTNPGRVTIPILLLMLADCCIFTEECDVFNRFAEGMFPCSIFPFTTEVGLAACRDTFDVVAFCCWEGSVRFGGFLDELEILSTDESWEGFIDVDESLNGHECV